MKGKTLFFSIATLIVMGFSADVMAQQRLQSGTVIKDAEITRHRDSVTLSMNIDITETRVRTGASVVLHPIYVQNSGDNVITLPSVEIMDRTRNLYLERNPETVYEKDLYAKVVKKGKKTVVIPYKITLPYVEWMDYSRLQIEEDLCGCGKINEGKSLDLAEKDISFEPQLAYVVPQAEPVKTRDLSGHAYLDFRVNRTDIDPTYRRNPIELKKILSYIDTVRNDKDFTITSIELYGYASPEGSYESNARLAERRTQSLKKYLLDRYHFTSSIISIDYEAENWKDLIDYINNSNLSDKWSLLDHINDNSIDIDTKERLMRTKFPSSYQILLDDCYPGLRRTDYSINYVIRSFDLDEAKAVLKTSPQRLSLEEMFAVAQSYEPGTEDFNYVFKVAALMFPEDDTAKINAANALLEQGKVEEALVYLDAVKNQTPESENARGVAYLLKKDYDKAIEHISKALSYGLLEAQHNMEFLQQ